MRSVALFLCGLILLVAAPSCREEGDGDADVDTDADGDGDADVDTDGDSDVEPPCMTDEVSCLGDGCHAAPFAVTCVGGTVVDPAGSPLADQPAAACAADHCYLGSTDSSGFFAITIPVPSIGDLAIYFPTETRHSPFCHYTELCDGQLHLCDEYVLFPAPTSGTAVPDGELSADLRIEGSDGAAIIIPAGSEVLLPIGADPWLALSRFPLDEHVPCFVDPDDQPVALYAVTPMDTLIIEPGSIADPVLVEAELDLPNDAGLSAGATVDVYVMGGVHATEAGSFEGEWRAWTTATVNGETSRIHTGPDNGIGYLTWFAVYER